MKRSLRAAVLLASPLLLSALPSGCAASSSDTSSNGSGTGGTTSAGGFGGSDTSSGGAQVGGAGGSSQGGSAQGGGSSQGGSAQGGGGQGGSAQGGAGGGTPTDCATLDQTIGQCVTNGGTLASCVPGPQDPDYAAAQTCCAQGYLYCEDMCPALQPLALVPAPTSVAAMATAVANYNAGCGGGGQWCSVDNVAVYEIAACTTPVTIGQIVTAVNTQVQFQGAQLQTKSQLMNSTFFGMTYSAGGPALLNAADNVAGSLSLQGWLGLSEVPCPNCTDFDDRAILYYPTRGVVVVVDGGHGYDS